MSYRYTAPDLLVDKELYFYTELGGTPFLDAYLQTRESARAALPDTSGSAETVPHPPLSSPLPFPLETRPLLDAALATSPGAATPARDWLISRIEVTKRLYPAYGAGGRKGTGDPTDLALYARAAELVAQTAPTSLRALNALLKLTDILLSQPEAARAAPEVAPHLGRALHAEIGAVTALMARHGLARHAGLAGPADLEGPASLAGPAGLAGPADLAGLAGPASPTDASQGAAASLISSRISPPEAHVSTGAPAPLPGVTLIAADTTRTRAYTQLMARRGLVPGHVLVLPSPGGRPGQSSAPPEAPDHAERDPLWQAAHFDAALPLDACLDALRAPVTTAPSGDINDPGTIAALASLPGDVAIYSGYGGQILRDAALGTGKRLLHIHGGYVPGFRGSTSNYYSMIADGTIGASAIFLSAVLDAGPLLARTRIPVPPDRTKLDHLHDSALRAHLLCTVLAHYARTGGWPSGRVGEGETEETFYVIHPTLKHIAVLGSARAEIETVPAQKGVAP